ncbi:hypothetical protein GPECTOR_13g663 [Gonium pectorale]|uniref:Uncharacterized protein n=1 Tax=Gonium pectorale TaxID=33097 RepID=A0A150GMT0_GONPE|nr:hypothetical protein GPECTOR_13g663 [Gonium pectorale]|eukprot:KXZ51176.1 hypothetical protein GPECTOR_13g663 [Gonium pectorale]
MSTFYGGQLAETKDFAVTSAILQLSFWYLLCESASVTFNYSTDGGQSWTYLHRTGTSETTGWKYASVSATLLPVGSAAVRIRIFTDYNSLSSSNLNIDDLGINGASLTAPFASPPPPATSTSVTEGFECSGCAAGGQWDSGLWPYITAGVAISKCSLAAHSGTGMGSFKGGQLAETRDLTVTSGTLTVSFWYLLCDSASVTFNYSTDSGKSWTYLVRTGTSGTTGWKYSSTSAVLPAGSGAVRIRIYTDYNSLSSSALALDDLTISGANLTASTPSVTSGGASESFECNGCAAGAQWTSALWPYFTAGVSTAECDLKAHSGAGGMGTFYGGDLAESRDLTVTSTTLTVNVWYLLCDSASVTFNYSTDSGKSWTYLYRTGTAGTTGWKYATVSATLPADSVTVRIKIYTDSNSLSSSHLNIDDLWIGGVNLTVPSTTPASSGGTGGSGGLQVAEGFECSGCASGAQWSSQTWALGTAGVATSGCDLPAHSGSGMGSFKGGQVQETKDMVIGSGTVSVSFWYLLCESASVTLNYSTNGGQSWRYARRT